MCLRVCPSHDIYVVFLFQSPDIKKVLTTQRTFDSEGEKNPSVLFSPPFCLHLTLPVFVPCAFLSVKFSKLQHDGSFCQKNNNCVLQRRSCTRTTRRRPYIMTQTRMPIPEKTNLTVASCSSTDPYAPPGASSVWSGIIFTSFSPFLYIRDTDKHTVYTQGCVCGVLEC